VDLLLDTRRDPALAAALRARLERDTVTLAELLGTAPSFDRLSRALVQGFHHTLAIEIAPQPAASGISDSVR
jgi:hypothetical protein